MTDSSNPDEDDRNKQIVIWVGDFFDISGWKRNGSGGPPGGDDPGKGKVPPPDTPKAKTPGQLMLERVTNPRPAELSAPAIANASEVLAIDGKHAELVEHLQGHDGSDDLTAALGLEAAVKALVSAVPVRAAAELAGHRKAAADRLARAGAPEGLPAPEALPLTTEKLRLEGLVAQAADGASVVALDGAITALEDKVSAAVALVKARVQKAGELGLAIGAVKPDPGALPAEAESLALAASGLAARLKSPHDAEQLADVEGGLVALKEKADGLAKAAAARALRKSALDTALAQLSAPDGCTAAEALELTNALPEVRALYAPPADEDALAKAEEAAKALSAKVQALAVAVPQRALRIAAVVQRLTKVQPPPGANTIEGAAIGDLVKATTALTLDKPFAEAQVTEAEDKAKAAEDKCAEVVLSVDVRAKATAALTARLDTLAYPAEAEATDIRTRNRARGVIRKAIAAADDDGKIAAAEVSVAAEETDHAALISLVAARKAVNAKITAAREVLDKEAATLEQGFSALLRNAVMAAAKALPGAADDKAVTALAKPIDDAMAKKSDSEVYAKSLRAWLLTTEAHAMMKPKVDADAARVHRETCRVAAGKEAAKCDWVTAQQELDKYAGLAGASVADMADVATWEAALKTFAATNAANIKTINTSGIPGKEALLAEIKTAREAVANGTAVAVAVTALTALDAKIQKWSDAGALWAEVNIKGLIASDPLKTGLDAASDTLKLPDVDQAIVDLTALKTTHSARADAWKKLGALQKTADGLEVRLRPPVSTRVSNLVNAAEADYTAGRYGDCIKKITAATTFFGTIEAWIDPANAMAALQTRLDPKNTYKFGDAADAEMQKHDFVKALKEVNQAIILFRALESYSELRPQADGLVAALAAQPALQAPVKLAVDATQADLLAAKPEDALKGLRNVLADKTHDALLVLIGLWAALKKRAEAQTARAVKMIKLPAAEKPLVDSLAACVAKAETAQDHDGALADLDAHETLLVSAQAFAAARQRALAVQAALTRAEGQFPGDHAKIYEGLPKSDLVKALAAADVQAQAAKYAEATKSYNDLAGKMRKLAENTAKLFEKADGTGSNAGHSLHRHGPDVSEDDLLRRLQTGIAPDNKLSETRASSKFDDPAAWLAGRELAIADAVDKKVKVDAKKYDYPLPADVKLEHSATIDHGGPIDMAKVGVKPNVGLSPNGVEEELGTYETYEELSGITRSVTKLVFVIDSPDGKADLPRTPADYVKRFRAKIEADNRAAAKVVKDFNDKANKDFKDAKKVVDDYNKTAPGKKAPRPQPAAAVLKPPAPQQAVADPTEIPGHWVVMQHYPEVKDWDQETGDYV